MTVKELKQILEDFDKYEDEYEVIVRRRGDMDISPICKVHIADWMDNSCEIVID